MWHCIFSLVCVYNQFIWVFLLLVVLIFRFIAQIHVTHYLLFSNNHYISSIYKYYIRLYTTVSILSSALLLRNIWVKQHKLNQHISLATSNSCSFLPTLYILTNRTVVTYFHQSNVRNIKHLVFLVNISNLSFDSLVEMQPQSYLHTYFSYRLYEALA